MTELTVAEIAALLGANLDDRALAAHGARSINGPAALDRAEPTEVSFLGNPRYLPLLETTRAGCVLVSEETVCAREDIAVLRCRNPSQGFSKLVEAFRPAEPAPPPGVDVAAHVDPKAEVDPTAAIGPGVVIGAGAIVAGGVVLHPGAIVQPGARIGANTRVHSCVVVGWGVEVGQNCVLHAGTVLGSDGFGFEPTAEGWSKIPQCGTVVVEDDVEIGANCAIDRGRFGATRIGRGAKLDNLVHVAHNVEVGPKVLLIAQVGIAGSSKIEERAILAGQVGIAGHVTIGAGARLAAQSGLAKDVEGGQDYFGSPARPQAEAFRILREYGRLPQLARRIKQLEARLAQFESEQATRASGGAAGSST